MSSTLAQLYDTETRPELVKGALGYVGAGKVLGAFGLVNGSADAVVDTIASMTTVAGLLEKKDKAVEIAAPYVAKARVPEGRKEIVEEIKATAIVQGGKSVIDNRVLKPIESAVNGTKEYTAAKVTATKDFAAPYVATVKDKSAPYVEKLEEFRRSERVEAMVSAFQDARAHPAEKVAELKDKAVDLLKYDSLRSYRDHIMSAEFQEDTMRLVKHDLPELAKRQAGNVKAKAMTLASEIVEYKEKAKASVAEAYEKRPSKAELKAELEALRFKLKTTTLQLMAELQAEIKGGYTTVKTDGFSLAEVVERLKRVANVVDKIVVTPLYIKAKETVIGTEEAKPVEAVATPPAPAPAPVPAPKANGVKNGKPKKAKAPPPPPSTESTDNEEMHDAVEGAH